MLKLEGFFFMFKRNGYDYFPGSVFLGMKAFEIIVLVQSYIHIVCHARVMAIRFINALKNIDIFHAVTLVRLRC